MNGARKLKCLKTVRLGEVLYDEQKRLLMLCRSCEHFFLTFQIFQKHLVDCSGVKHVVNATDPLNYAEDKRETKLANDRQELHIYNIEDVSSSAIDWETELEDPRWYDDGETCLSAHSKPKSSHSKENVVGKKLLATEKRKNPPQPQQMAATKTARRRPSPIHTYLAKKMKTEPLRVPHVTEDLQRLVQPSPAAANGDGATTKAASANGGGGTTKAAATTDTTQQILSKLRACGVDVKRSKAQATPTPTVDPDLAKKQKTLEIMRKLQSKGIQCTKIKGENKTNQISTQRLMGEQPEPIVKSSPKLITKQYNSKAIIDTQLSMRAESSKPKINTKDYNAPKIKKVSYAP
ncbi:uncharacterized protein LOC117592700 isoform X1 [Drosophila guanche]|uniref:Uncharacterized protein n=1 Tax=Drosophila guanche TaxID=7266 RepID=A0A3B0J2V4_DROGU|nr:uncharacterized protein LOC117592700 isoform X1 [Drosophila guanche]SPP75587.1 Hypothetical predicted protein [Drosophila guanche]